jgi:Domain of unknown function (DUF4082)
MRRPLFDISVKLVEDIISSRARVLDQSPEEIVSFAWKVAEAHELKIEQNLKGWDLFFKEQYRLAERNRPAVKAAFGTRLTMSVPPAVPKIRARAIDDSLNIGAAVSVTVTVTASSSLSFFSGATPTDISVSDPNSVELGLKFSISQAGTISAIRFYKGP